MSTLYLRLNTLYYLVSSLNPLHRDTIQTIPLNLPKTTTRSLLPYVSIRPFVFPVPPIRRRFYATRDRFRNLCWAMSFGGVETQPNIPRGLTYTFKDYRIPSISVVWYRATSSQLHGVSLFPLGTLAGLFLFDRNRWKMFLRSRSSSWEYIWQSIRFFIYFLFYEWWLCKIILIMLIKVFKLLWE